MYICCLWTIQSHSMTLENLSEICAAHGLYHHIPYDARKLIRIKSGITFRPVKKAKANNTQFYLLQTI